MQCRTLFKRWSGLLVGALVTLGLLACSSQPTAPQPTELGPNPALLAVRPVWSAQVGRADFPLSVAVAGDVVLLAGGATGLVSALDANSGALLWKFSTGAALSAGVGGDGRFVALVTQDNALVTLENGRELWRVTLLAKVLTAPLVAGDRVFVLAGDRSVLAFDARSGRKLWTEPHPGDALLLRQAGVLLAVNNTLIVGLGGRLAGINPDSGQTLWSAAIASPRGTNDVERLVDLVAGVARSGDVVCARAFQAAIGCVDSARGRLVWQQNAVGSVGLHGDAAALFGVESDARVRAWHLATGQSLWQTDALRYHHLSAPLLLGRSVIVGDEAGRIHFLSRADGSLLARLSSDGSPIVTTPVLAGKTLVVVTQNGAAFGFQPE